MTDPIRSLLAEMAEEIEGNRRCLMGDSSLVHPLAERARAALAAAPPAPAPGRGGGGVSTRNLRIQLGALCPPIDEQLWDQGLRLDMDTTARALLQRDTHEVTRLLVRGILTEAEAHKARKRIMQIIKKQARPLTTAPTPEPPTDD